MLKIVSYLMRVAAALRKRDFCTVSGAETMPVHKPRLSEETRVQKEIVHQCLGYPNWPNLPTNHHLLVWLFMQHAAVGSTGHQQHARFPSTSLPSELLCFLHIYNIFSVIFVGVGPLKVSFFGRESGEKTHFRELQQMKPKVGCIPTYIYNHR